MKTQKQKDCVTVKAFASGSTATSGRIVASYKGITKEIPAVVFSEHEVEKLFEGIVLLPQSHSIHVSSGFRENNYWGFKKLKKKKAVSSILFASTLPKPHVPALQTKVTSSVGLSHHTESGVE